MMLQPSKDKFTFLILSIIIFYVKLSAHEGTRIVAKTNNATAAEPARP